MPSPNMLIWHEPIFQCMLGTAVTEQILALDRYFTANAKSALLADQHDDRRSAYAVCIDGHLKVIYESLLVELRWTESCKSTVASIAPPFVNAGKTPWDNPSSDSSPKPYCQKLRTPHAIMMAADEFSARGQQLADIMVAVTSLSTTHRNGITTPAARREALCSLTRMMAGAVAVIFGGGLPTTLRLWRFMNDAGLPNAGGSSRQRSG